MSSSSSRQRCLQSSIQAECTDSTAGSRSWRSDGYLEAALEERFSKVKAENPALDEEELTHAPDLEEKTRFSHNIYRIKQEELGVLVDKLMRMCPAAIEEENKDDNTVDADFTEKKEEEEEDKKK